MRYEHVAAAFLAVSAPNSPWFKGLIFGKAGGAGSRRFDVLGNGRGEDGCCDIGLTISRTKAKVVFRADAAFAKPEIYEALEERGVKYAIRIPANNSLERDIVELLTRPVGRPSHKPVVWYEGFLYQAASWKTARYVVAKVEFHTGELFPRVGFIVTNLETPSRAVVRFYNKRGTAEQ
jgi:hypothetical protein